MFAITPTIVFNQASFAWPDGTPVLDAVTTAINPGRTGLVGDNGTGKTTVLRLITGELAPTAGSVTTTGDVGYLPQHVTLATDVRVADLLGVGTSLDALRAIEAGRTAPDLFDAVADDWDIEARTTAALGTIGLPYLDLDRPVGTLSGGETMLVAWRDCSWPGPRSSCSMSRRTTSTGPPASASTRRLPLGAGRSWW